jgi:hypothetical protein
MQHVGTFNMREMKPKDRLKMVEGLIIKFKKSLGVVFIDGIADLVKSVNSEDEADEILFKLMHWTKVYDCHICCVLHQNKKDNFATGWLGTQIMKKAELVIAVEKDTHDNNYSNVSCDVIRGVKEFEDFKFYIDDNGFPRIGDFVEQTFNKAILD